MGTGHCCGYCRSAGSPFQIRGVRVLGEDARTPWPPPQGRHRPSRELLRAPSSLRLAWRGMAVDGRGTSSLGHRGQADADTVQLRIQAGARSVLLHHKDEWAARFCGTAGRLPRLAGPPWLPDSSSCNPCCVSPRRKRGRSPVCKPVPQTYWGLLGAGGPSLQARPAVTWIRSRRGHQAPGVPCGVLTAAVLPGGPAAGTGTEEMRSYPRRSVRTRHEHGASSRLQLHVRFGRGSSGGWRGLGPQLSLRENG